MDLMDDPEFMPPAALVPPLSDESGYSSDERQSVRKDYTYNPSGEKALIC
jgi:hypothetical protein